MKNINATPLIDWFAKKFDADIVYLLRHPGAVAESIVRQGWNSTAWVYLENSVYSANLTPEQRSRAWEIVEEGSPFQQCVLEWCLDNLYSLRVWRERPWLTLSYEELIMRPHEISQMLCQRLRLPEPERMLRFMHIPWTGSVDSKKVVQAEGPRALVARWMKHINEKEFGEMEKVLKVFEVDIYKANNPYPAKEICHFGPLVEGAL